ncbi:hypothetical protein DFO73_110191 [Cytobacillus oceanisediminis]|uniref:Uncharacterized protein n=1 Tax=Cytobacillus oceanisediminis TaxID=665099 RepID=A0A2V2ZRJ5_9BACI|nr:hypothetical protein [Cytobacillus oceanisediminis]PWW26617.1 hypothetical protein DFO73_110191 [Cytobacillus oceanisediminis]
MKTLSELVTLYNKNYAGYEEWKLSDFRKKTKPLEELIRNAVWGYLPDLKRDSHQNLIPKTILEKMVKRLLEPKIIEELKKCKRFDDIFTIVYEFKVPNFSSLCVYDTSLRLGAIFNLYPEVVYLHRGALDGTRLLHRQPWRKYNNYTKFYVSSKSQKKERS